VTEVVTVGVLVFQVYALAGIAFAVPFVLKGAARLDPDAVEGTFGFRALIFPATAALWPLLLVRWIRVGRRS
jgi:hypothetical protein